MGWLALFTYKMSAGACSHLVVYKMLAGSAAITTTTATSVGSGRFQLHPLPVEGCWTGAETTK
jgi:hypothetical protein